MINTYLNIQKIVATTLFCFIVIFATAQRTSSYSSKEDSFELTNLIPESRVVVNSPVPKLINPKLPTTIVFYALPNGNTIEQTAGKIMESNDDWHFDIQHIAAQTRFIRENDPNHNYITVYLEASMRAWTSHNAKYPEAPSLYIHLIDTVCNIISKRYTSEINNKSISLVSQEKQQIILSSHSGGGRFIFSYIKGVKNIPSKIKGIVFIDSNYGYEDSLHAEKILDWIKSSQNNKFAVYSYIDTTVRLEGKPIVSNKGGTGYRSKMMVDKFSNRGIKFRSYADTLFHKYVGLGGIGPIGGRIQVFIKENPTGKIYHTILVERNGFINSILMCTPLEEKGYKFWGDRAYSKFIE